MQHYHIENMGIPEYIKKLKCAQAKYKKGQEPHYQCDARHHHDKHHSHHGEIIPTQKVLGGNQCQAAHVEKVENHLLCSITKGKD